MRRLSTIEKLGSGGREFAQIKEYLTSAFALRIGLETGWIWGMKTKLQIGLLLVAASGWPGPIPNAFAEEKRQEIALWPSLAPGEKGDIGETAGASVRFEPAALRPIACLRKSMYARLIRSFGVDFAMGSFPFPESRLRKGSVVSSRRS